TLQLFEPLSLPELTPVDIQIHPKADDSYQANVICNGITLLLNFLTRVEANWSVDIVRDVFPQTLRNELQALWQLCNTQHQYRKLCAMLELSSMHLDSTELSLDQVEAFRYGLNLLRKSTLADVDLAACYDQL
ncbi:MAG: hypothetical protein AAF639_26765, partial [Chloroflexota bacterium]